MPPVCEWEWEREPWALGPGRRKCAIWHPRESRGSRAHLVVRVGVLGSCTSAESVGEGEAGVSLTAEHPDRCRPSKDGNGRVSGYCPNREGSRSLRGNSAWLWRRVDNVSVTSEAKRVAFIGTDRDGCMDGWMDGHRTDTHTHTHTSSGEERGDTSSDRFGCACKKGLAAAGRARRVPACGTTSPR
ncbi:hypothetical protein LZ30DRAFT_170599 [Colletotrichum cereale]|nr:hypothetical protein LZ30DRAFT_170599 [Colletotrichum cereale]